MEAPIYDVSAKKKGTVKLSEDLFALPWNADLVHQVMTSLMSTKRKNVAHTKTRGEVRGGGKKPWKQKGTGRARHGSTRSPIWVGGGVTHGPRNDKNFERKVSKSMRVKALYTILSKKFKDGEVLFVDSIALKAPKTREAVGTLKTLSGISGYERLMKRKNAAVIALSEKNKETERSMQNLGNLEVIEARNLHPLALLSHKYIVIENPEVALKKFPSLAAKKKVSK
ncbi:50S ribosomal protein L4 [Candidatus Parcubacteria bacterium]|nr:50S ribosomal protein L4 [Candidatus Parcubacteria bacterium]